MEVRAIYLVIILIKDNIYICGGILTVLTPRMMR